jgi:hypothetical protein
VGENLCCSYTDAYPHADHHTHTDLHANVNRHIYTYTDLHANHDRHAVTYTDLHANHDRHAVTYTLSDIDGYPIADTALRNVTPSNIHNENTHRTDNFGYPTQRFGINIANL